MSERIRKVNQEIQRNLGEFFSEERKADNVFVTVTAVETNADMRRATVWCSVIGATEAEALKTLQAEKHGAQNYINSRLSMKYVPKLEFKIDHGGEYAAYISEVIRKVNQS